MHFLVNFGLAKLLLNDGVAACESSFSGTDGMAVGSTINLACHFPMIPGVTVVGVRWRNSATGIYFDPQYQLYSQSGTVLSNALVDLPVDASLNNSAAICNVNYSQSSLTGGQMSLEWKSPILHLMPGE